MNGAKPPSPKQPDETVHRETDGKAERLAAALRENLKRRKAQQRSRHAPAPAGDGPGRKP